MTFLSKLIKLVNLYLFLNISIFKFILIYLEYLCHSLLCCLFHNFVICTCLLSCFSRVWLFATPWTIACQAPLSMGFSRQEYWSGGRALLQGIFLTQESNPCFLHLLHRQAASFPLDVPGKPLAICTSL